ncbi:MAG: hypothetical protein Q4A15_02065, partial [Prevotellaceae bacterium]|nr:hypothetical protein [Prevotellaceae bacterium]
MNTLTEKIFAKIKRLPYDPEAYEDMFAHIRNVEKEDFKQAHDLNKKLRTEIVMHMKNSPQMGRFYDLYKKTLLFDAPHFFDEYL